MPFAGRVVSRVNVRRRLARAIWLPLATSAIDRVTIEQVFDTRPTSLAAEANKAESANLQRPFSQVPATETPAAVFAVFPAARRLTKCLLQSTGSLSSIVEEPILYDARGIPIPPAKKRHVREGLDPTPPPLPKPLPLEERDDLLYHAAKEAHVSRWDLESLSLALDSLPAVEETAESTPAVPLVEEEAERFTQVTVPSHLAGSSGPEVVAVKMRRRPVEKRERPLVRQDSAKLQQNFLAAELRREKRQSEMRKSRWSTLIDGDLSIAGDRGILPPNVRGSLRKRRTSVEDTRTSIVREVKRVSAREYKRMTSQEKERAFRHEEVETAAGAQESSEQGKLLKAIETTRSTESIFQAAQAQVDPLASLTRPIRNGCIELLRAEMCEEDRSTKHECTACHQATSLAIVQAAHLSVKREMHPAFSPGKFTSKRKLNCDIITAISKVAEMSNMSGYAAILFSAKAKNMEEVCFLFHRYNPDGTVCRAVASKKLALAVLVPRKKGRNGYTVVTLGPVPRKMDREVMGDSWLRHPEHTAYFQEKANAALGDKYGDFSKHDLDFFQAAHVKE